MAEVKIDELSVSAFQSVEPTIQIDELSVNALQSTAPEVSVDRLYARGIASIPATIKVDSIHAGGIRRKLPPTRFKLGYKAEVLTALGGSVGVTLSPDNYELQLGSVVETHPELVNLRLLAKKSSGYRRYSDVTYRRAEASLLNELVVLEQLKSTETWPLNTTAQIVARINSLFGTTLTDLDFVEEATPSGVDRTLKAAATSYYFQPGSEINLGRLDNNARSTEVPGLTWTDVSQGPNPFRVHSADFSNSSTLLSALTGSILTPAQATSLVSILTSTLGGGHGFTDYPYTTVTTGTGAYGLRNAPYTLLTLPVETDLPVDNSGWYNRALVIDLALSGSFKFRYLVFHFNV